MSTAFFPLMTSTNTSQTAKVNKFFEKTSFKTSWCRTRRFGVIYPGPFHPIVSLYTVLLVACALSIYAINPALVFDYYCWFIALGVVLALNLFMDISEPDKTRLEHEHLRGLPRQLPTPPNNHIIYATLQSTLVPVFLVAPILLHLSNEKIQLNISHLPLAWAYILLLISGLLHSPLPPPSSFLFNLFHTFRGGSGILQCVQVAMRWRLQVSNV